MTNYVVSEQRADAVVDYVASQGIAPARLSSRAVGETDLLTLNNEPAALALNRRTEFVFYGLLGSIAAARCGGHPPRPVRSGAVELGVLGPVELVAEGVRVALGGPKQRLVIGLLAAWRGRVVVSRRADRRAVAGGPAGPPAQDGAGLRHPAAAGARRRGRRHPQRGRRLPPRRDPCCRSMPTSSRRASRQPRPTTTTTGRSPRCAPPSAGGGATPSATSATARRWCRAPCSSTSGGLAAMYELFEREIRRRPGRSSPSSSRRSRPTRCTRASPPN